MHFLDIPQLYQLWQLPFHRQKVEPITELNQLSQIHSLVELGCGPASNRAYFPSLSRYWGIDLNPAFIRYAQKHFSGEFVVGNVTDISISWPENVDAVLVNSFFHHLNDSELDLVCRRISKTLAPTGVFHLLDLLLPEKHCWGRKLAQLDRGQFARKAEDWKAILSAHFEVDLFYPFKIEACKTPLWHMFYLRGTCKP